MAAVINTNISSLNAQRNLTTSQSSLATSLQRLSSGLRINSAKDDAAGLAISQRMTSQINGLNRAAQNANDGISLAQTAEGALGQVGDALQRIRELSVQSANATNSSSDRAALQQEVNQLVSEIGRIGDTTSFNGLKILDGSYTDQQYQIGANAGETINVSVDDSRASQLGLNTLTSGAGSDQTAVTDWTTGFNVNGTDIAGATDMTSLIAGINAASSDTGVTAARATTNTVDGGVMGLAATETGQLTINGTAIDFNDVTAADSDAVAAQINKFSTQTGVTATSDGTNVSFSSANGADITIEDTGTDAIATTDYATAPITYSAGLVLSAKVGVTINVTGATADELMISAGGTTAGVVNEMTVSDLDISTVDGANDALMAIDAALTQVSSTRAQLGAIQNRFSAVVANLSTTSENLSASRSRIQDTDFAAETANMTRGQILQQAGTAMLAQANALPNNVLSLLR